LDAGYTPKLVRIARRLTVVRYMKRFVCEYSELEIAVARGVLRCVEASLADWTSEKDLVFRDVVQYVVIVEYLALHPKRSGTTANMVQVLLDIIPGQL